MIEGSKFDSFYATPTDIKQRWFDRNSKYDISYIVHVLKNEMNLKAETKAIRYHPFGLAPSTYDAKKVGKPFFFENPKEVLPDSEQQTKLHATDPDLEKHFPDNSMPY